MAGNKYKGYTNTGKPLKIAFDVEGNDTPPAQLQEDALTVEPRRPMELGKGLCFMSFGSGSSGNCAYLGTSRGGVLIDAGIAPPPKSGTRKKKKSEHEVLNLAEALAELSRNGVTPDMIKGVLVTHAHQDHMRCAYHIARRCNCLVYCTRGTMEQMLTRHAVSRFIQDYYSAVFKEIPFRVLDMEITPFETSHDIKGCVGYSIEYEGERFVVGSDMGAITERAAFYMSQANYLMIESNYDLNMLDRGTYPEYLKERVKGQEGHLDNAVAAQFIAEHYHERMQYVFMCHLSNDNNTPEQALLTMRQALEARGLSVGDGTNAASQNSCDIQISVLPRYNASSWFVLT